MSIFSDYQISTVRTKALKTISPIPRINIIIVGVKMPESGMGTGEAKGEARGVGVGVGFGLGVKVPEGVASKAAPSAA